MENIIQYFTNRFGNNSTDPVSESVSSAIKRLNRQQRGQLKIKLFDQAKLMAANTPSIDVIQWLEKTYSDIEANTFRLHKVLFSPGHDIPDALSTLLDKATETCDICVFTISDGRLAEKIMAAYNRGVRVRIISDGKTSRVTH